MLQILELYNRERERGGLLRVDLDRFKEIELPSNEKVTYTGVLFFTREY
jgi:hypothetical protein